MSNESIATEFYTELGRRLLKARKHEGISRATLGSEIGAHRNTVERWELGGGSMELWMVLRVCDVLHVNILAVLPPTDLTWGNDLGSVERERNRALLKSVQMERDPVLTLKELAGMSQQEKTVTPVSRVTHAVYRPVVTGERMGE